MISLIRRVKSRFWGYAIMALGISLVCNFSYLLLLVSSHTDSGNRRINRHRNKDAVSVVVEGVLSVNGDIDPKGACVGNGGSRIKAINEALNGEKIDIFVWKSNPVDLIAEALTPARVVSVMTDEKEKRALVIANDDQFSLAIGRNGQNAKLAAFATGWKIDIKKLSEAYTEGIDFRYNVNC